MLDWLHELVRFLNTSVLQAVVDNGDWSGWIVFALAFAESMAVLSLAVPFTAMIIAIGALMCTPGGSLDPWTICIFGVAGASLGDAVSYWIGRFFQGRIPRLWPFRAHPEQLERGYRFFEKWGVLSVFVGRFLGPLRAVVPLVAGMMRMPQARFQISNIISAILWLPALVLTGCVIGKAVGFVLADVTRRGEQVFGYVFLFFVGTTVAGALYAFVRGRLKRRAARRRAGAANR
jgi:membrane protein DedA with SNARE-associated domain